MRDSIRKGDFEHSNVESNGNSSDEEENQLPMSGRKGDAENLIDKEKNNMNEEEDIGICKCRTKSPIDKYNEDFFPTLTSSNVFLFINVFSSFSFKFSASPFPPHIGN